MLTVQTIECKSVCELMQSNPKLELIDVRTPAEYGTVHARGARLIPLDQLDPTAVRLGRNGDLAAPLYVICKSGSRSAKACEALMGAGFTNVYSVAGGTDAWTAAGLPVEQLGRKVLPLDRQIQMAAGLICLAGAVLGHFVNPYFFLVCAFVGLGLTMAGLTGFCPMAMVMAKMPWNQGSGNCAGSCAK